MSDLLLELFSEEIPARMQARAADDLRRLVTDALVAAGLTYEGAKAFATPRRLTLTVMGLPARQANQREERKGPRVGAPEGAIAGFLKSVGLSSLDGLQVQDDPKGAFYVATIDKPGRATVEFLSEVLPEIIRSFPWPKSMRWGSGSMRWVRPLHSVLCTFDGGAEEPEVVPFAVEGIQASDITYGHRFHAPKALRVRRFEDYTAALGKAFVTLDPERRKEIILTDARNLALAQGLELVPDDALADEVAGLVEWPVVLMGSFDPVFLSVPEEVIRTTIRANQKCFVLRDPKTTRLTNRFILVSNIEAIDDGAAVVAGNERVVRARLSDARFFWETDKKIPLFERLKKLDSIVFHEKLGTQGQRVQRLASLAERLAPLVGADLDEVQLAANLAKADLVTETVGEFPELQGLIGRYLAPLPVNEKLSIAVAQAIGDHYKPQGPNDRVPRDRVTIAVALADKLDMLTGFWSIGEKPTGSKDPYALRRAALGVIRIVLENGVRLRLRSMFSALGQATAQDLLDFFIDRLKVQLREQGARHDLVDAVFALPEQDDLTLIVRRIEALGRFLDTDDGKNLLAGYRRAVNILRAEEKKDGPGAFGDAVNVELLGEADERALFETINWAAEAAGAAVQREDFVEAMQVLAQMRGPVDNFFERVTVNADNQHLRKNRLRLLTQLRRVMHGVADFGRVGG